MHALTALGCPPAIKAQIIAALPATATEAHVAEMIAQAQKAGLSIDWTKIPALIAALTPLVAAAAVQNWPGVIVALPAAIKAVMAVFGVGGSVSFNDAALPALIDQIAKGQPLPNIVAALQAWMGPV